MEDIGSLALSGFDALPASVAVLDERGVILHTNRAWRCVGIDGGLDGADNGVGTDYLAVCDRSDDEDATGAAAGLRDVIEERRDEFTMEYPCHTADRRQWFTMRAEPFTHDGDRYVLVMHVDITDRRIAEERVQRQADRMEAFAKLLSHDIRNPLSVALGEAMMLDERGSDEGVESLRSSLERMESIVDDALVLVSTDRVETTEAVPLAALVEKAWSHVDTADATLSVEEGAIRADPDLASHLFENLLRNAIEHGGSAVRIEVGATEDGFYVADDGPGIPPEERDRVFDSGYSSAGGSGFGLAIVAHVASAHGWRVRATESADGGARFEFGSVELVPTKPRSL